MPLPQPNLYPAFNVVRLSHVELTVTDLAKCRAFYVDTLGRQTDATQRRHLPARHGGTRSPLHRAAQGHDARSARPRLQQGAIMAWHLRPAMKVCVFQPPNGADVR